MNNVSLIGRLTRDADIRHTKQKNITIADFTLAVTRSYKNSNGEFQADFIKVLAYGKTAEFIKNYITKGQQIGIIGRIMTSNYTDKTGIKRYVTEVVAERIYFADSKKNLLNSTSTSNNNLNSNKSIDFSDFDKNDVEDYLPF